MENNCLVTKLKSTVNDNSLLKVGEMFIDIIEQESPTNQTNRLYLNTGNIADLVVEVENGAANLTLDEGMASGWTNKITLVKNEFPSAPVYVRNGNYRVKVSSKYILTEVGRWTSNMSQNAISVDTKYLKYSTNMVTLISGLSGNIANISGCTKLTILYGLSSTNVTGSLSDLAPLTALTNLSLERNPNITGDIKGIRQSLARLSVYETNITGELIEFVKTQRANGRTTDSCSNGGWWGANITFNGVNPGGGWQALTWTENTITNNGVTVNQ